MNSNRDATELSLSELALLRDEQVLAHAQSCGPCGQWLQNQRIVAASMKTLRAETCGLQAGPAVETAVLRAFRQGRPAPAIAAAMTEKQVLPFPSAAPATPSPVALRLSRFFEVGAYAAAAAALIVGMFLGVRLLHHGSGTHADGVAAVQVAAPAVVQPTTAAQVGPVTVVSSATPAIRAASIRQRVQRSRDTGAVSQSTSTAAGDDVQNAADPDYVALMFCDPLSCAADSQVVRMELPSPDSAQPQTADLIVGFDGVVRAVRLVN